jgi:N-acetylmuramoyl-L-alanine amidase
VKYKVDIREWKKLALRSIALLAVFLLIGVAGILEKRKALGAKTTQIAQEESDTPAPSSLLSPSPAPDNRDTGDQWDSSFGNRYIRVEKSKNSQNAHAILESDDINFSLLFTIEGVSKNSSYDDSSVKRWYKNSCYTGTFQKKHDTVKQISYTTKKNKISFTLKMNTIYEASLHETQDAWYIVLKKPRELYDHILVIDAGHGGSDEGTGSVGWKYREETYALEVTLQLKKILDKTGIKVYYTRLEDKDVTKDARVRLANAVKADLFLSIHCNSSGQTETTANGVETLYTTRKGAANKKITSKKFAQNILEEVCSRTDRHKRKSLQRNNLYLLHHSNVPVAIVEIGYMTNSSDMKYIKNPYNQVSIARGIYQGIINSL